MRIFKKVSIETAHQSKTLEKKFPWSCFQKSFQYACPQKMFPVWIPISFPIFINIPNKIYWNIAILAGNRLKIAINPLRLAIDPLKGCCGALSALICESNRAIWKAIPVNETILLGKKLSVNRPARSYRFWGPAARSYRFWGPLGTIWDHLGTIIRRSYRF